MSHEFSDLEKLLAVFLSKLEGKGMARVNRAIGVTLRQSQSARIGRQQNPDGSAYEARKPIRRKDGRIRTGAMFKKIRTAKYLKQVSNAAEIRINFERKVRRIAKIHQFGEMEKYGDIKILMPKRELLGITEEEERAILDAIVNHIDL